MSFHFHFVAILFFKNQTSQFLSAYCLLLAELLLQTFQGTQSSWVFSRSSWYREVISATKRRIIHGRIVGIHGGINW